MGATTLDIFQDKLDVWNASESQIDEALISEVLKSLPPAKLVERANLSLDSATQNTNAVATTYTWAGAGAIDGLTYAAGVFTATRAMSLNLHPFLEVTNGTANNRCLFVTFIQVTRDAGGTSERGFSNTYIRDDNNLYDSGSGGGAVNLSLVTGDSFSLQTRRIDTGDATDDNPADQARSYMVIEEWINGLL